MKARGLRRFFSAFIFGLVFIGVATVILGWLKVHPANPPGVVIGTGLLGAAFGIWREK